jgi:anti-sigma regulatory factor (Ser/Thr protein kinase)
VAASTLAHAGGTGIIWIWATAQEVICQITDPGRVDDPLAGRRRPAGEGNGQGLFVVNQLCDLVELRSGAAGTTVRMRMLR